MRVEPFTISRVTVRVLSLPSTSPDEFFHLTEKSVSSVVDSHNLAESVAVFSFGASVSIERLAVIHPIYELLPIG